MSLRFADPLWLALLALSLPTVWATLKWLHAMTRFRSWTVGAARVVLLALIAGALAGASAVTRTDRVGVVFVVDVSESVRRFAPGARDASGNEVGVERAVREWIGRAMEGRRPDDLVGVVAFDGSAIATAAARARALTPEDVEIGVTLGEGTDIGGALRLASALIPSGVAHRIVLVSDGAETSGDALAAVAESTGSTPIDVLPLSYRVQSEVVVESVDVPPQAQENATVAVRVSMYATGPARGRLTLLREGRAVDINGGEGGVSRALEWGPGRKVEVIPVPLTDGRVHRFEAVFEPEGVGAGLGGDTSTVNNRAGGVVISPGKGAVLLVDGVSRGEAGGAGRTVAQALERAGLTVEVVGASAFPTDPLALQRYDLVMLENVPAEDVSARTQQSLVDFVRDLGGGLVMIGGPDSFGAGGWKGSALEEVLPVRLDLPEELIIPSAALMIVIDSSGSMGMPVLGSARSQQEIANEGAALAVRTLDKQDLIGVIAFDSESHEVVRLQKNSDPEGVARKIRGISPGGGTNLYPALAQAGNRLMSVEAQVKHVIVLSDGVSMGDPTEGGAIAAELSDHGITVSTIAVGDGADVHTLAEIALEGGGQHYRVTDPNMLPRIFLKETRVVRKPLVRESDFVPVDTRSGSALTLGMPGEIPPLGGLVLTRARLAEPGTPPAIVDLVAPSGEPVLAHWRVGLGQVAAFTSDAHKWASRWVEWPGYQILWSQIARAVSRPPFGRDYDLTVSTEGEMVRVRLEARDEEGAPRDLLTIPGVVYGPGGAREPIVLRQTGPGVYTGEAPARSAGSYVAALTPREGGRMLAPAVGATTREAGPELRVLRSNDALLREIASRSGGRVLSMNDPMGAWLFARQGLPPTVSASPLWRSLLVWAVIVMLLDVATRRVAWDRLITREAAAELARMAMSRGKKESGPEAVGAMRRAKERVDRRAGEPGRGGGRVVASTGQGTAGAARGSVERARGPVEESRDRGERVVEEGEGSTSGLLAAKRRAARRFEQGEEGSESGA
ncbi:MAG: VWA domain-containing protein [Phycisphaerales bacterium]